MHSGKSRGRPPAGERTQPDELLAAALEGDRIQVERYSAATSTWNYAGSYELAQLRPTGLSEFLRARGGGGKYRARIRRSDGTYGLSATVTIEGPSRSWAEPESASSAPTPAPIAGGGTILEKLLTPMAAAFGAYAAKKFLEDKQTDPLVLELLKRGGATDPLELQRAIAEAEARGEARGRELGKLHARADAPKDGSGGAIGALERNIPKLLDAAHRHMDIEEAKVRPRLPAAGATSTPAAQQDPLEALLLSVPMAARKFLLGGAENGEPAAAYAPLVINKLDDVTRSRLPELLERDDFAATVCRVYPAFEDHREWVDELTEALRDAVDPPDDDEDDDDELETPSAAPEAAS